MDFLDAPERLIGFFEGRALAAFLAPTGRALRAAGVVLAVLRRITGVGLLEDLTTFFQLLSGLLDGLRTRATDVQALLTDHATAFLIVTSTERAALDEAIIFAGELERAGMRRCGVIVNRVHQLDPAGADTAAAASRLTRALGAPLAEKVARVHSEIQLLARRDRAALERLRAAIHEPEPICLADRETDVHDIGGIVDLHSELFA
jgi:anion-transporting  ArsA/GET3 family ATPase